MRTLLAAASAAALLSAAPAGAQGLLDKVFGGPEDILDAGYRMKGGGAVDVEALIAAAEAAFEIGIEIESARYDAQTGAMVIANAVFSNENGLACRSEEIRVWGADVAALAAYADGSLEGERRVFDRLLTKNDSCEISVETPDAENPEAAAQTTFSLRVGASAYDEADLRVVAASEPAGPDSEALGAAAKFAAAALAFDYKASAAADVRVETSGEGAPGLSYSLDRFDVSGVENGRVAAYQMTGLDYALDAPATADGPAIDIAYAIGSVEGEGIDLRDGLSWLARLETPPVEERDLLDLGASVTRDLRYSFGGREVLSVGEQTSEAFDFDWLIPSDVRGTFRAMTIDVAGFVAIGRDAALAAPDLDDAARADAAKRAEETLALLKELDLETVEAEGDFLWAWAGETGDARLKQRIDAPEIAEIVLEATGAGPDLAGWAALFAGGVEAVDQEAVQAAVVFEGATIAIEDVSLIEKSYAIAAKRTGARPQDLRASAPAVLRISSQQFRSIHPDVPKFAAATADFLEQGGVLTIKAEPPRPLSVAAIVALQDEEPAAQIEAFGISVTHAPPAE